MGSSSPGMNLLQDIRHSPVPGTLRPIGVRPDGGKLERMAAQTAKIEAGHVHLPENASWLGEFLDDGFQGSNHIHAAWSSL